jgi:hypothetical protein
MARLIGGGELASVVSHTSGVFVRVGAVLADGEPPDVRLARGR